MHYVGVTIFGRISMRLAAYPVPPHKDCIPLSYRYNNGFIESTAIINHSDLRFGSNCFIGGRVSIFEKQKTRSLQNSTFRSLRIPARFLQRSCYIKASIGAHNEKQKNASL